MSNLFDQPVPSDEYQSVLQNGQVQALVKKSSVGKLRANTVVSWIQSTSTTSSVFTGGANVVTAFNLPSGLSWELDIIDRIELQISLTNNDGVNAATLLPIAFMLNRYEINAGMQLELAYSENLIEDRLFYSKAEAELVENQVNENYAYSSTTGLATSATTLAHNASNNFFLELPSFLSRSKPFLKAINQNMTLNVYWNAAAVTAASLSQNVSMTQARLYFYGYQFEASIRQKLLQRYATIPHYLFYNCPEWTIVTGEVLSNLARSNTAVGVYSGKQMTDMMVSIIPNAALADAQYAYVPIQFMDLKNGGLSIFSDSLYAEMYRQMGKQTFQTTAPESVNIYLLPHSVDCYKSITGGDINQDGSPLQLGTYLYGPNMVCQIQTVTNVGSQTITFTGHSACVFKIQAGAITKIYA